MNTKELATIVRELKVERNKLVFKLNVIDHPEGIHSDAVVAEVVAGLLTGEIDKDDMYDELCEYNDEISSFEDIIDTLTFELELDEMQESFMRMYDIERRQRENERFLCQVQRPV